jgi:hypothetical protein
VFVLSSNDILAVSSGTKPNIFNTSETLPQLLCVSAPTTQTIILLPVNIDQPMET